MYATVMAHFYLVIIIFKTIRRIQKNVPYLPKYKTCLKAIVRMQDRCTFRWIWCVGHNMFRFVSSVKPLAYYFL